jgi:hypothetical protein
VDNRPVADWNRLRAALAEVDRAVTFSWDELDELVGGLPRTASRDRSWWSGDRTHVRMWRTAGFAATQLVLGEKVTFRRKQVRASDAPTATRLSVPPPVKTHGQPSMVLIAPSERYQTTTAKVRRAFLAACDDGSLDLMTRLPWYVITTERGLVEPNEDMPVPGQRLADTPPSYQSAWAAWIVERLHLLQGTVDGHVVCVAAPEEYAAALRAPLQSKGAHVVEMVPR